MGKLFSDPNLFAKLAANPRTSKHLADPSFMQKMQMIQQNPSLAESMLGQDARMIDVLGALMGIDMSGFSREEGSDELPPGVTRQPTSPPPPTSTPGASSSTSKPAAPEPKKEAPKPAPEPVDVEMTEEEQEEAKVKAEAEEEKKKGAAAYKARDFATAETHFSKAWDLWPKDLTYLTNLGAVYFEMGDYDKAIETCEKAVESGREIRADYKLIAKALGRIGTSYAKKGQLADAIKYFNKSLTEHRTPDVLNKLRETEKQLAEQERQSYIDPAKAAEAREEGNKLFKAANFVEAVKLYTECVKRDPSDPRGWTNRAAAYQKLAALPEALKDAEKAIEVDAKYVKAYIRKSHVLFGMREYNKALDAIQDAAEHDDEQKNTAEITQQMIKIQQAIQSQRSTETDEQTFARAMKDPEVAEIMSDPIMRSILDQAQSDPPSIQEHMKNPLIRQKITKLINAGILRTR
jgi:stress-induced-phosphoprotein 1